MSPTTSPPSRQSPTTFSPLLVVSNFRHTNLQPPARIERPGFVGQIPSPALMGGSDGMKRQLFAPSPDRRTSSSVSMHSVSSSVRARNDCVYASGNHCKNAPKDHTSHTKFEGVEVEERSYKESSDGPTVTPSSKRNQRVHQAWLSSFFSQGPSPRTPPPRSSFPKSPPDTRRVTGASVPFRCASPPSFLQSRDDAEECQDASPFPVQARYHQNPPRISPVKAPLAIRHHEIVGHPSLKIHRLRLPPHLIHLLDAVVTGCEEYAATLPYGWLTDLYSLTKQDIALREIPHLYNAARPITAYVKRAVAHMYGANGIKVDRNQPHVLKYSAEDGRGHTGVELHHDKCDYTANLMLSRSSTYVGGGTFFPDADEVVRLEFGEFLLHPGGLVHSGVEITRGTRYLMVMFANVK